MSDNKVSVNIDRDASVENLHEQLQELARARATKVAIITAKIYHYAVNNRNEYKPPLKNPGRGPGKHIAAKVSVTLRTQLTEWAKQQGAHRNRWCSFLIQKSIENNNLEKILDD